MKRLVFVLILIVAFSVPVLAGPAFVVGISTGGPNGGTSSAVNATGANFFAVAVAYYSGFTLLPGSFSDSSGNTYTLLSSLGISDLLVDVYYCANPTVTSSMTFTLTGIGSFSSFAVGAFSGMNSAPFDQQSAGATSGSTVTIQPGSLTPNQANSLLFTVLGTNRNDGTPTIDTGFSSLSSGVSYTPFAAGSNYGVGMSYFIQSAAAPINPTWTVPVAAELASVMIDFKPGGSAPTVIIRNLMTLGVGR